MFAEVKERVVKKLTGWKGKLLSIGGREILVKDVAQAVPTYIMSCFQLPKTLCKDLENMMRNFWWGQRDDEELGHIIQNIKDISSSFSWCSF